MGLQVFGKKKRHSLCNTTIVNFKQLGGLVQHPFGDPTLLDFSLQRLVQMMWG